MKNEGMTSQRRTTPLGTVGPTRSRAAERMITYRTLLMRPSKSQLLLEPERFPYWRVLPNSQKARQTRGSAPLKTAASRVLYIAHDADGEPGRGSISLLMRFEGLLCIQVAHDWMQDYTCSCVASGREVIRGELNAFLSHWRDMIRDICIVLYSLPMLILMYKRNSKQISDYRVWCIVLFRELPGSM